MIRIPRSNRLEALKGDRLGQHSVRINDQYRVCFRWTERGPEDVEIVDYHWGFVEATGRSSRLLRLEVVVVLVPTHQPPTHPGEMLLEEFLKPLGISQSKLAELLGVSFVRVNEIVKGKRGVTPDTALRLERLLGMEAQFWMNLQLAWDLYHALHSPEAATIKKIKRFNAA